MSIAVAVLVKNTTTHPTSIGPFGPGASTLTLFPGFNVLPTESLARAMQWPSVQRRFANGHLGVVPSPEPTPALDAARAGEVVHAELLPTSIEGLSDDDMLLLAHAASESRLSAMIVAAYAEQVERSERSDAATKSRVLRDLHLELSSRIAKIGGDEGFRAAVRQWWARQPKSPDRVDLGGAL